MIRTVVEHVLLPHFELRLCSEHSETEYDQDPDKDRRRSWVEKSSSAGVFEVKTIEELCEILRSSIVDLRSEEQVAVVARLASKLLDTGRVVTPTDLYNFLEERYEVSLIRQRPRIEGQRLRYLAVLANLGHGITDLDSIDLDLDSAKAVSTPIQKRQA